MNLEIQLQRLQKNLEIFDLEAFYHDETFFDILEDRKIIDENYSDLTKEQRIRLDYLDKIIDSYYHIYKQKDLKGYEKLSFKLLSDVEKISNSNLQKVA